MAILLLIIIATVIRISCYLLKKRKNTRIENAGDYADHHGKCEVIILLATHYCNTILEFPLTMHHRARFRPWGITN